VTEALFGEVLPWNRFEALGSARRVRRLHRSTPVDHNCIKSKVDFPDATRVLNEQIGEREGAVVRLKHTRNSPLNVSNRLPPETLGNTSHWKVTTEDHFRGLEEGSYSFLLVRHGLGSHALRSFGVSGATSHEIGRNGIFDAQQLLDLALNGVVFFWGEGIINDTLQYALRG